MNEQEVIAKCCISIAKTMRWYAELGTDDCLEVNTNLLAAMKTISDHLTKNNQIKFADWLTKQTEEMKGS